MKVEIKFNDGRVIISSANVINITGAGVELCSITNNKRLYSWNEILEINITE